MVRQSSLRNKWTLLRGTRRFGASVLLRRVHLPSPLGWRRGTFFFFFLKEPKLSAWGPRRGGGRGGNLIWRDFWQSDIDFFLLAILFCSRYHTTCMRVSHNGERGYHPLPPPPSHTGLLSSVETGPEMDQLDTKNWGSDFWNPLNLGTDKGQRERVG